MDKKIDVIVTDEDDISVIKENLNGASYGELLAGTPSCGFSLDISITFRDGEKRIMLCPACDSCYTARVGDSRRYITIKDRKSLEDVLGK